MAMSKVEELRKEFEAGETVARAADYPGSHRNRAA